LQGECLSAKLFTLFINDIVKTLHDSNVPALKIASKDIHMLLYADDIVLLSSNVFDLQSKIDIIRAYFRENDLKINLDKTKIVMFKYGRERKVQPSVFWDNNIIYYVRMYTYLGVNFYANLDMNPVCLQFIKKAKNAENQLFSVMWRSKTRTFDSRLKVYNSLVKSVLNYCSPVWGIENVNKLKIFQNNYLRRLFNLPRKSPNWFCRLECDCYSIEYDYMKNLLYFWKRLFLRPRNSLIYVCYKQLQLHADNMNMKHNWYSSFRALLMKWNCHEILDIESSSDDPSYLSITPRINRLVSSIRLQSQQLDIIRMQARTSMPLYQIIKTHCKRETYLNANLSWSDTTILAQLRSNTGKLGQVNLKGLQYMFNQSDDNMCEKCFNFEVENCFHVMFNCTRYNKIKSANLNKYVIPDCPTQYLEFFDEMSAQKMIDVCNFVKSMLAIRNKT
jgi:hypothetical protein